MKHSSCIQLFNEHDMALSDLQTVTDHALIDYPRRHSFVNGMMKTYILLCLNLTKRHIEFIYGQVPAVRLESFGMVDCWGSILPWGQGMKVCPWDYTSRCKMVMGAVNDGVD